MAEAGTLIDAVLTGDAALQAVVSGRIYSLAAPDGTPAPYVIVQRLPGGKILELDGVADIENPHYQVFCIGSTHAEARDVAAKVKVAMEAASTFEANMVSDPDEYDPESGLYITSLDFSIWNNN